jgi:hypothetical protein
MWYQQDVPTISGKQLRSFATGRRTRKIIENQSPVP